MPYIDFEELMSRKICDDVIEEEIDFDGKKINIQFKPISGTDILSVSDSNNADYIKTVLSKYFINSKTGHRIGDFNAENMVKKYPPRLINAIVSVMLRKSSELLESYEKAKENAVKNLQET